MELKEITIKKLEEWIEIYNDNYMSRKLPRCYMLQDKINEALGLSLDTYRGNGIATMNLDRGSLLCLCLAILKLKEDDN